MTHRPRFALLRIVVLVSLAMRCGVSDAVGLGPLRLQSALGQPLRATVQVLGSDAGTLAESCIRVILKMPDGSEIVRPQFGLKRAKGAAAELSISTVSTVDEPAVSLLVEITCAPTLHRDYQLLLDMKDGLPRVVSTMADELKLDTLPRGSARDGETAGARARQRSRRSRAESMRSIAAGDLETMSPNDAAKPPTMRAKAAPAARSVLKLTQTDLLQIDPVRSPPTQPAGLKLSQSLGLAADPARSDSEELSAAKARFQAVLRGEDALVAARRQLKTLQAGSAPAVSNPARPAPLQAGTGQPAAAAPAPQPAAPQPQPEGQAGAGSVAAQSAAARQSAAGASRSALASTSLMIGMALLMAAGLAMIWRYLRDPGRKGSKAAGKATPWWLATSDDATREAELLASARASVARKDAPAADAASGAADTGSTSDKALERYVNHFVGRRDATVPNIDERIEPLGLANVEQETAIATEPMPARDVIARGARPDEAASDLDQFDDAPRELARSKLATFELVSDVMQEAEFWKMLNETQRAIDILENYCNSAASASPAPWLYLADLYDSLGDGERRAELCNSFRKIFNGRLHEADANTPPGRESLEGYPHLMDKISTLWAHEAVVPFLQGLLVNDRESPREGFYLPVYQEILLLIDVAMEREQALA